MTMNMSIPMNMDDEIVVLSANIDDLNPEIYQACLDRLFEAGALDAVLQPIYMKKQRPGVMLTVLSRPEDVQALIDIILRETSTLGVRYQPARRQVLERRTISVDVLGGQVRIKLGYRAGELINVAPEYEDCRKLAAASGAPVKLVYQQAVAAFWASYSPEAE
jgi:uncharacterized protein (DUF111 family)